MDKTEAGGTMVQNRVIVRYVDTNGKIINNSLSVFGAVGSRYHLNIPVFRRYRLVDQDHPTSGDIPSGNSLVVTLTYAPLGNVVIHEQGETTQTVALQAQDEHADKLQPIRLAPRTDGKNYYEQVGRSLRLIEDPSQFIPREPTVTTAVQVLTADEFVALQNPAPVPETPTVTPVAPVAPVTPVTPVADVKPVKEDDVMDQLRDIPEPMQVAPQTTQHATEQVTPQVTPVEPVAPAAPTQQTTPTTQPVAAAVEVDSSKAGNIDDVRILLARALNKQAEILRMNSNGDVLTKPQAQQLITTMRTFLQTITVLEEN